MNMILRDLLWVLSKKSVSSVVLDTEGDIVLGLTSEQLLNSNGYSLIRKIIEHCSADLSMDFDGKTLADTIMTPTHIYVKSLLALIKQLPVKGLAHITGGGMTGNVPRCP